MVTQFSLLEGIKLRYILEIVLVPLRNYSNDFVTLFLIYYLSFAFSQQDYKIILKNQGGVACYQAI